MSNIAVAGPSADLRVVQSCRGCSLTHFETIALSNSDCLDLFIRHGVINDVASCGRCGRECILNRDTLTFRCQRMTVKNKQKPKKCAWFQSARVNSFLERSHISPQTILRLVASYLWLKPPRQDYIIKNCKINSETNTDWFSFYREVLVHHCLQSSQAVGGPDKVVEVDEAKFGRRKYNRGRRIEGQWVFGGVERDSKKSFLVPVDTRDAGTLLGIIRQWVMPGTTIYSDCWKAYSCLNHEGYQHLTVNHSLTFKDPETGVHTNTVERTWRDVRSTIPRYGVRKAHFVGYLAEYQFKRKYPNKEERLHEFLIAAASLYPAIH